MNIIFKSESRKRILKPLNIFSEQQTNVNRKNNQYLYFVHNHFELERGSNLNRFSSAENCLPFYSNPFNLNQSWFGTNLDVPNHLPHAIICDYSYFVKYSNELSIWVEQSDVIQKLPFIVVADESDVKKDPGLLKKMASTSFVDDCYIYPLDWNEIDDRITWLKQIKPVRYLLKTDNDVLFTGRIPFFKRFFDVCFAFSALLFFAPIMSLIALAIKIESRGPVFYKSKRAGTGYQVFDFFKFRSMTISAESELTKLQHLNQYNQNNTSVSNEAETTFVKINNDPRVTKVGWFIRKTSLDELPQLFNVLKGDMSIVGNRPLPLYEAEQLTKDVWSKRFLAPAGITGLWQITKRGNSEMSAIERIELDNTYAEKCSFWFDIKIILLTLPAMLQKEAV